MCANLRQTGLALDHHRGSSLRVSPVDLWMPPPYRAFAVPDVLHEVFKHFAIHPWLTTPGIELVASEVPSSKSLDDCQVDVKDKRRTLAHATTEEDPEDVKYRDWSVEEMNAGM